MRRWRFPHRPSLLGAILALVAAALLVLYLQRRSVEQQRRQTTLILQQVCEQTATVLAGRLRQIFDAAIFETIEGIGHPELKEYDLPRMASFFNAGLWRHPYIDRFFFWSERLPLPLQGQVLFYRPYLEPGSRQISITGRDGRPLGDLFANPELGREILRLSHAFAGSQRSFAVAERPVGGVPYQIVIHFLWDDERRKEFFVIIGYTVNLRRVGKQMFQTLMNNELATILNPDPRSPELIFTVLDERAQVIYGAPVRSGVPSATAAVDMLFFPGAALKPFMAGRPETPVWHLAVSAASPMAAGGAQGHWLFAAAVFLILIALFCAITVDRQASRLSKMQSDFVANVSHQLKTPLSLLAGASETLRLERVRSPEKLKEYLEILRTQTARLSGLVERILQFSRIEARAETFRFEPVDLVELVGRFVKDFKAEAPHGDVAVRFESGADVPRVTVDAVAIEQVLANLLENAVKYGNGPNDVLVRVAAVRGQAVISVRDSGVGIDEADLPHIFDKFYRGRNNGHRRRGFGLGLAIALAAVRAHGGKIVVDSKPGQGSEFRVFLPGASSYGSRFASRAAC